MKQNPSSAAAERRAFCRIPCALQLQFQMGVNVFRVDLTNISQSGMFVQPALHSASSALVTAAVLKPGKVLRLRLQVAGNAEPHLARARVTRQSDFGIGVEFIEVTPAFATLIAYAVASDGNDEPLRAITGATLTLGEQ